MKIAGRKHIPCLKAPRKQPSFAFPITRKRKEFDLMIDDEWQAIKDYTGFETTTEWRAYWASERGTDVSDNTAIRDIEEAEYTFRNWMEEHNVSVDSHEKWEKEVNHGTTKLSYKEWTEQ